MEATFRGECQEGLVYKLCCINDKTTYTTRVT